MGEGRRGVVLPRQAPAQQASSSSRSGDTEATWPGCGPGRRLAVRNIPGPAGASGLGTGDPEPRHAGPPLGALAVPLRPWRAQSLSPATELTAPRAINF
jgi:hypothetical protein